MNKAGVLLINLGTPDACTLRAVYRYLKEFLSDPRIIDMPSVWRWLLVNCMIVPARYKRVAAAYQKIWQTEGSPLRIHSLHLQQALAQALGPLFQVELGMRYGHPSITQAMTRLKDCHSIVVLPLFPQYSSAATGSALQVMLETVAKQWNVPALKVINQFYQDQGYINAYADKIANHIQNKPMDLVLFSYHGLSERQITKSGCVANCNHADACPAINDSNAYCYRAHCYATTRAIANQLNLNPTQYAVSFQSRLGRIPWVKPYTDVLLPELIQKGVRHLAMVSPSFVADCLETLEEIDIRLRAQWRELGGETFIFIPCLNDSPLWVEALVNLIHRA